MHSHCERNLPWCLRRLALFCAVALAGGDAYAQGDLPGKYIVRLHEDQPERIPVPELADFVGLPINDATRQFALSRDLGRHPERLVSERVRVRMGPIQDHGVRSIPPDAPCQTPLRRVETFTAKPPDRCQLASRLAPAATLPMSA